MRRLESLAAALAIAACSKPAGKQDAAIAPLVLELEELVELPLRVKVGGTEVAIPARAATAELPRSRDEPIAEVTATIDGVCGATPVPIKYADAGRNAIALTIDPPLRFVPLWIDNRGGTGDAHVSVGRTTFHAPRDKAVIEKVLTAGCTGPVAIAIGGARAGELDPELGGLVVPADKRCYAAIVDDVATELPAARVYAGPIAGLGTGVISSRTPVVQTCVGECKGRVVIATDCVPSRGRPGATGTFTVWIDNRGGSAAEVSVGARTIQVVPDETSFLVRPLPRTPAEREVRIAGKKIGSVGAPFGPNDSMPHYILDLTGRHCYVRDVREYSARLGEHAKYDLRERVRGGKLREIGGIDYFLEQPPSSVAVQQWQTSASRVYVTDCR